MHLHILQPGAVRQAGETVGGEEPHVRGVFEHPPVAAPAAQSVAVAGGGEKCEGATGSGEGRCDLHGAGGITDVLDDVDTEDQLGLGAFDDVCIEVLDGDRVQATTRGDDRVYGDVELVRVGAAHVSAVVGKGAQQLPAAVTNLEDGGRRPRAGLLQQPVGQQQSQTVEVGFTAVRRSAMMRRRLCQVAGEVATRRTPGQLVVGVEDPGRGGRTADLTHGHYPRPPRRMLEDGLIWRILLAGSVVHHMRDHMEQTVGEQVAGTPHLRVLYLSWRDRDNPEAGGSETFVERTAEVLTGQGHDVTLFTSRFPGAAGEARHGRVRVLRRGNRFTTYLAGLVHTARHREDYDIVIDVQNGVPFWSPLAARVPVVNVVHHVHRDQWHTFFPRPIAALGWLLESRVAPRVYRKSRYVTVSEATREELAELGITPDRVDLIYSGNDQPDELAWYAVLPRSPRPSIVVLGRLVPHKQVEVAIDVIAALRAAGQDVDLHVVGGGYWQDALEQHAAVQGVADLVTMHGFVDEHTKHSLLASAWLVLMPSGKEGWGLTIVEAGLHATPTIAFHHAGGPRESIVDGVTGYLVDDVEQMTDRVRQLLSDPALRETLGANAREFAMSFDWQETGTALGQTLLSVLGYTPRPVAAATAFRLERKDVPTSGDNDLDAVSADRQSSVA